MRASPALRESRVPSMRGAEAGSLHDLLRLLLKRISTRNGHHVEAQQDFDAEKIILDTEIDGARYLFVRLPKAEQAQVRLSPREQEIVRMVAQGHSNKIIAGVLNISSWTVCTHLRRVFGKLRVGSRAAMVARLPEITRMRPAAEQRSSPPESCQSRPAPRSPLYVSRQPSSSLQAQAVVRRSGQERSSLVRANGEN